VSVGSGMPAAVTFDFWNTLMWEAPGSLKRNRLEFWRDALARAGAAVPAEALVKAHDAAHLAYVASWEAGRQFQVREATAMMLEQLPAEAQPVAEEVLIAGFDEGGRGSGIEPCAGVRECLRDLSGAGVRLGVICDIGLTPSPVVRGLLEREGLSRWFDHMAFSDEIGYYKPDERIFRHALAGLGRPPPADVAHVGDRLRTDVAGARAAGMRSVRYNAIYDDPAPLPEADLVTGDLAELPARLGELFS
jgi:FMN phosphatase YigB (HAD superfamily)